MSFKPEPFGEGESIILEIDDDKGTILTKELAQKLNQEQNDEFEINRDKNPFDNPEELELIEKLLIISSAKSKTAYLNDIAKLLENIRVELEETDLIILGVENTPWLYQDNEYLPVRKALDYLEQRIDKTFNGGFLLRDNDIYEFVPHLFWLVRCNASLPYFYMSYPKSKTVITLCKYGVLHFEFYDESEKAQILKILSDFNFKEIESCDNPINFNDFDEDLMISS